MSTPKTTTLRVVVPDWARWVATDTDGAVWVYDDKPIIARGDDEWSPNKAVQFEDVGKEPPSHTWRRTLRRIK